MYRRQDDRSGMVDRHRTTSFIQSQPARKSIPDGKEVGRNVYLLVAKNPFVLCQALIQLAVNPFPSSQPTFLSSSTASGNGLHLPHAVFCSKSPESSTCYENQRVQRPKTRKNKSTEKSAHADMVQRLPPSLSLAIHGIRLDRLLARRRIQVRNKLCASWRCLAIIDS